METPLSTSLSKAHEPKMLIKSTDRDVKMNQGRDKLLTFLCHFGIFT